MKKGRHTYYKMCNKIVTISVRKTVDGGKKRFP